MIAASVNITVLNVYRGFMVRIVQGHAKTLVTTVLDTMFVKTVKLVFMVGHVQSVAKTDVKRVNLHIHAVLAEMAGRVHYANVVKTVVRKPVEMMGNV